MFIISRAQKQRGGIDSATGNDDDPCRITFFLSVVLDMHRGDFATGSVCFQARYFRVSQQGDIWIFQRWHNAADVCVSLCVYKTREAVAGVATDTGTLLRISLVEHYAKRRVKRIQPKPREIVAQL